MSSNTKRIVALLAGLAALVVVGSLVALCALLSSRGQAGAPPGSDTTAAVTPRMGASGPEFVLRYGRSVTNLSSFAVFDDAGNLLWQFESHAQGKPEVIEYGVLPVGAPREYVESFPAAGATPVDIRGTDVVVRGNVRFIVPLGAGHELFEAELSIPNGSP